MSNGEHPDKVVRISLNGSGLPVPEANRVQVKREKQKIRWCADFDFAIEIDGSSSVPSGPGGGDCAHALKLGPFVQPIGTIIKYSIIANGQTNDPEIDIQP